MKTMKLSEFEKRFGNCNEVGGVRLFFGGDKIHITNESARKALKAGHDVFALEGLLTSRALAEYNRTTLPERAKFRRIVRASLKKLERTRNAAIKKHMEATSAAREKYDEARITALVSALLAYEEKP